VSINVTMIGQLIAFAIFVWFTKAYVWPPLAQAMREREQRIADGLAASERGAEELEKARADYEQTMAEARQKASEVLAQADRRSSEMIEQAREDARREGERMIEQARSEINQELTRARQSLREEVAGIAAAGAGRILKREIDADTHKSLIEDLVAEI